MSRTIILNHFGGKYHLNHALITQKILTKERDSPWLFIKRDTALEPGLLDEATSDQRCSPATRESLV
jgi:hypothetical protein